MKWYVVKAQAEREEKIRDSLLARIRAEGAEMESKFGRVLVPSEHLSEIRGGRQRVTTHKMYPGYMLIEMELDDKSWFLVASTPGIAGFVGSDRRRPLPMQDDEVSRIIREIEDKKVKPRPKVAFSVGESVRIKEGPFENYDGVIEDVIPSKGLVRVAATIFGRSTSVELEYSKVEKI